ncbi:hypothetical protein G7Z17_g9053 [Cylindrodendrum hubeiense]|uniref:Alpha/beta-hydrolase n=1 Tax=Cylindrodendrum hubeiense TaxID=595255 RepID=A0A9P5H070_9HYPO|nr:hypothetical protein G7Z17_g9053 [Cylindrodendrum hubeiense]
MPPWPGRTALRRCSSARLPYCAAYKTAYQSVAFLQGVFLRVSSNSLQTTGVAICVQRGHLLLSGLLILPCSLVTLFPSPLLPIASIMARDTQFYRSQIGESSVIDYSHTDFPLKLFFKDVYYFFVYIWALPWIVWPMFPSGPKEFNELAITWPNLYCVVLHTILAIMQLLFILSLPFTVFFPIWMVALGISVFMVVNWVFCRMLNGGHGTYESDEKYAEALPEHAHEQWIFLNGVAVGQHWMQGNLNRLALTFGRPVLGIHNRTSGIVFDVVECLIQRNFSYATGDIRICFKLVRDVLYNPRKTKVIFVLHSQGGIEGSLVLDWLLQELPQDLLSKLEVYTFGNAANHFNNPHRHNKSQSLSKHKPLAAMNTVMTETTYESPANGPEDATMGVKVNIAPTLEKTPSFSSTRAISAAKDRAIGHIEHYAHCTDFVSIWGVLHFATNRMGSRELPRFLGRLFARSHGRGGHQFNQHYLDGMFPLKFNERTNMYEGADDNSEFMNEIIKIGAEGDAMANAREAFEISWAGTHGFGSGEILTPVEVHGLAHKKRYAGEVRVKDLSRLWSYRNGMIPQDGGVLRTSAAV